MSVSIREIIGDEDLVALTYHQALEPVEGRAAVVDPPDVPWPAGEEGRVQTVLGVRDQRSGGRDPDVRARHGAVAGEPDGGIVPGVARGAHPAARGRGGWASGGSHRTPAPLGRRVDPGDGVRRCHPCGVRGVRRRGRGAARAAWAHVAGVRGVGLAGHARFGTAGYRIADHGARRRRVHPLGAVHGGIRTG